jgi:hypothetical protein
MADATDETGAPETRSGIDRRSLIKRAAATGAVAWTAPILLDSLMSPAAALGSSCTIVSFRGASSAIAAQDNSSTSSTSVTVTPTIAGTINQGDLIILVCAARSPTAASVVSAPGYAVVTGGSPRNTTPSPPIQLTLLWKAAGAGEDTTPDVTFTNMAVRTSQNNSACGVAAVHYRCVSTTAPFDPATCANQPAGAAPGGSFDFSGPNVTTLKTGSWVFNAVATSDNNTLVKQGVPFTSRFSFDFNGDVDFSIAYADTNAAVTANVATTAPTWRQTNSGGDPWVGVSGGLHLASVP